MDAWTLGGGWTSGLRARTPACAGLDARAPPVSHRLCRWPGAGFLPPPHSPHLARVLLRTFLHRFSGFCGKTPGCWRLVRAGEVEEGGLFVDDPLAVLPEARINTKAKASVWGPAPSSAWLTSSPCSLLQEVGREGAGCTSLLLLKPFWFKFFRH